MVSVETRAKLNTMVCPDGDRCPTCDSELTPEYRQRLADQRAELVNIDRMARERFDEAVTLANQLTTASIAADSALREFEAADRLVNSLLDASPVVPPMPAVSEVDARRVAAEFTALDGERLKQTTQLGMVRSNFSSIESAWRSAEQGVAIAQGQLNSLPSLPPEVSEEDYRRAVTAATERSLLESQLAEARKQYEQAEADCRMFEALVGESRQRAVGDAHLKRLRDALKPGPGGLASKVVDYCLSAVAGKINERLDRFGASFTVRVDDQAAFTATTADGDVSAARLSGGQKMILALAFRLSVLAEYGGDLGFLCLDEPTVGLDEANRSGLSRYLAEVGRWAAAGDSQLIIVTHDPHLAAAADTVVRL